jgi:transcriptional regulator with XRE-family HTH domain
MSFHLHAVKEKDKPYAIAFGENLKTLIQKHKTTPETVAALGGIETKQVYRVLNGEHNATLPIIRAIAKGLGVQPTVLFDFQFED